MPTTGQYRQRVTFTTETRAPDGMGGAALSWVEHASVWAEVKYARIQETGRADAIITDASLQVKVRYRSDLTPAMRLVWEGKTYEITSLVDPDGRRRELKIACSRV